MQMIKSCAFTGHRPKQFPFRDDETDPAFLKLRNQIKNTIVQLCNTGCRVFYCGMAEGVDLWCGEIVLELMNQFQPALKIIPVVPYYAQPSSMSERNKKRYHRIMEIAEERYLVSRQYTKSCFMQRNRFLVDSSDALIAVMVKGHERTGTGQTYRYAQKMKKKIFLISL